MPNRQNPCAAVAVQTQKWYQALNGRTKAIVQLSILIGGIVTGTLAVEYRFAKASDVQPIKQNVSNLVAAMTIQSVTRQTVLKLKEAEGTITGEERVELDGLKQMLEALQK